VRKKYAIKHSAVTLLVALNLVGLDRFRISSTKDVIKRVLNILHKFGLLLRKKYVFSVEIYLPVQLIYSFIEAVKKSLNVNGAKLLQKSSDVGSICVCWMLRRNANNKTINIIIVFQKIWLSNFLNIVFMILLYINIEKK
jgi:hypothetical protein